MLNQAVLLFAAQFIGDKALCQVFARRVQIHLCNKALSDKLLFVVTFPMLNLYVCFVLVRSNVYCPAFVAFTECESHFKAAVQPHD